VREAEEFLSNRGYETESLVGYLWPSSNWLRRLTFDLTADEIADLAEEGVPLVSWSVTFYDPQEILGTWRRIVVSFDQHGKLCEFRTYSHSPQPFPRDRFSDWLESTKLEIAGWLAIDPTHLRRRQVTNRMFNQDPHVGAVWSAEQLVSGKYELVVGIRQSEDSFHVYRTLSLPGMPARAAPRFAMPKGFSFWAAMLTSALLAFGMGIARTDTPPQFVRIGSSSVTTGGILRLTLLVGIGVLVVVGLIQAAAMLLNEWYTDFISLGFLGGAALFTWLWILVRRHDPFQPSTNVSRWLRVLFIAAVPAAYAIASFACLGWSFEGCCRACTLVRYGVAPLVFFAILLGSRDRRFYAYSLMLGGVSLVPHCVCGNAINRPWIDWLGGSPMCYLPGFTAAVLAVSGLSGAVPRFCAAILIAIGVVVLSGSMGHTVFHFPW
jgi:hypothetical protein